MNRRSNIRTILRAFAMICVAGGLFSPACLKAQDQPKPAAERPAQEPEKQERPAAPELAPSLGWLNIDHALKFSAELKGHVVVLDFWTYCCINCMHILPDLDYLEQKYKDEPFVVIGVHSAKFENESKPETIRAAMGRYDIHHPVVIDNKMAIWNTYGVHSWPTFVVIDSEGKVVGMGSGEGLKDELDEAIGVLLKEGKEKGTLAKTIFRPKLEKDSAADMPVAFPGKVLADAAGKRLFIADSNHNRILVTSLPDDKGDSKLIATYGSGKRGAQDGDSDQASFNKPQGIALLEDKLYVADTENHTIRAIDLKMQSVRTVAGTGKQGADRTGGEKGRAQAISSPWDVVVHEDKLYIAMAGTHQIWTMDLKTNVVERFAGSGREDIQDAPLAKASLAQTSGLTFLKGNLYFADSETSSVRMADLKAQEVKTLIGHGLFDFGDIDGDGDSARLQHCLGIANDGEALFLADTYNHKIKRIDPATRKATSLYGTGKQGKKTEDGKLELFEPGGLSIAEGKMYVADTNNHRIVAIDTKSGAWSEVKIAGLSKPAK